VVASLAGSPLSAHASNATPIGPQAAVRWDIPPRIPDGPITLPNGRVLPIAPADQVQRSVQAEMIAAHASDRMSFTPGARPMPLAGAPSTFSEPAADTAEAAPVEPMVAEPVVAAAALPNGLRKEVFGFLPYWMLSDSELQWMQYQLVSTIAYFGVGANTNGSLATASSGWSGWNSAAMTGVINNAHAKGVKVVLTVTMMAWDGGAAQATLLGNATAREQLVANIVAAVRNRNADGVNLDFEPVGTSLRDQYTSFVRQLKAGLVAAGVGSYLTVCTTAGAATWATGYDVPNLVATGAADAIFVMGYDYSWSGSARAGGVAPMESPYILDVNESVDDFLGLIPGSKLIWGVPYYGRTWLTTSNALNSPTVSGASGQSKAYYYVGNIRLAGTYGRRWDAVGRVPWFAYWDSTAASWVQGYYDDATSLGSKWDMVNQRGLRGTGMWTLLMDQGSSDLWNLIANKFVTDTSPPVGGIVSMAPQTDALAVLVSWKAVDVGSGVASYTVQYRDRAGSQAWSGWLNNTTAKSAYFIGQPDKRYEFRVSAVDTRGNRQPWLASAPEPGAALAVGGFATVASDTLNVRSGAGTSFGTLDQRASGDRVAVLAGPISSGGYNWYQVQFGFSEWPSSDYPRVGWMAASTGTTAYLQPTHAPTTTTLVPSITSYAAGPSRFSPNGDAYLDSTTASFTLAAGATVTVDVLNPAGQVVRQLAVGSKPAGTNQVAWDGRLADGSWATGGAYLLRVTAVDGSGSHVAPAAGVDSGILARWGVVADIIRPYALTRSPGPGAAGVSMVRPLSVTFSESVTGVDATSFRIRDTLTTALLPGAVSYDSATGMATLQPLVPLYPGRQYRVELTSSIADAVGNKLAYSQWWVTAASAEVLTNPIRKLTIGPGYYSTAKFNAGWGITGLNQQTLAAPVTVLTSQRRIIPGQTGAWYYVSAGTFAGYWIREQASVVLVLP
jgi:spore germination protein YaaH